MSCVSAPNAQMRPQYTRPQMIVVTTVNTANAYHARLYANGGRLLVSAAAMPLP